MSAGQRIMAGLVVSIAGLAVMAAVWVGAAAQTLLLFGFGFALAAGGATCAASAMKAGNVTSEQGAEPGAKTLKLSAPGLVFAIIGGLIMAFCGGCTLLTVLGEVGGSRFLSQAGAALVFGGFPFTVGLVIWLLAMASRRPQGGC